ncbi:MAG: hypothetical protein QNJ73_05435 [Gammaproteobacteria bacterium]|nr:hypothetical protein [Gammaproteobacteria bacterium]
MRSEFLQRLALITVMAVASAGCASRNAAEQEAPDTAPSVTAPVEAHTSTPVATAAVGATATSGEPTANLSDVIEGAFDLEKDSLEDPLPPEAPVEESVEDPCVPRTPGEDTWLDKAQQRVSWTVCGTTRWFDGFFGDRRRYEADITETYGRLGVFGFYDDRNGFDPDFRFRARFALPALRNRGRLLIGRGDERELIEERGTTDGEAVAQPRPPEDTETSWLVGLGFQRGIDARRGFDTSFGVRLRSPPDPFAKLRYRHTWDITDATVTRWVQTGFWTNDRGFGTTTSIDVDHVLARSLLLRWANSGTVAEDRDGLAWYSSLSLFQGLSNRRALTYRSFINGETGAEESLNNYGFNLTYRQRILRKWLFVELVGSVSWPKYLEAEPRETNLGAGIGFEMYFGPVPDRELR